MAAVSAGALLTTMVAGGSASADGKRLAGPIELVGLPGSGHAMCLDVRNGLTANFTPVQIHDCNGSAAQHWDEVEAGSTVRALGKCLDVKGGGTLAGTTVDLYDCNGSAAQVWIPLSNETLYNPQSNKCLDDPNSAITSVQQEIWTCVGTTNQRYLQAYLP